MNRTAAHETAQLRVFRTERLWALDNLLQFVLFHGLSWMLKSGCEPPH